MRRIIALLLGIVLALLLPTGVLAAETEDEEIVSRALEESGIQGLSTLIPEEGRDFFRDGFSADTLDNLTPEGTFEALWETVSQKAGGPIRLLMSLVGVVMVSAMAGCLGEGQKGVNTAFATASALTVTGLLADSVITIVTDTTRLIEELSLFMLSFIPVFSGAAAAAGRPASALVYYGVVFSGVQFFSQIAGSLILPLISIFLALGFTASVTDVIQAEPLAKGVRSCALWMLSLCLTIFIGLLTIKGLVSAAADGVTVRAAKFALSSFVPVVGSALSEAYTSLFSCMGLVKSTIGVFGILVMAVVFLPLVIRLGLYLLSLQLAATVADLLAEKRAGAVMRTASSALSVLLGLVISYGMMILVSVTVVLLLGNGG